MTIEVKGFEEAAKAFQDMANSIKPETLNTWADKIIETARSNCIDQSKNRIRVEKIPSKEFEVKYIAEDAKSLDCLIKSFEYHLKSMPDLTRKIFEGHLDAAKKKRDSIN